MALIARKRRIDAGFDLTPLIDVVFQLLIFLMISSQFTKPESIVDLPQGKGGRTLDSEDVATLTIGMLADGSIELDGERVSRSDFTNAVGAHVAAGTTRAKIRGDRESQYGLFVELMEEARSAGVESLGIVKKVAEEGEQGGAQ